jgi:enoyl-CoA hydratase/carnithine racemase
MSDSILLERQDQIATIILNRPERRNAINTAMWTRLIELARELDADDSVRVIILRGAGNTAFSAGADISEFETSRNNSTNAKKYAEKFDGALDAVASIGKPTLSMIRGFCVGGGLELASCTDIRIAADDSKFGVPIAHLGLLVGYHEMRRLVALVGPGVVMDLLLTARIVGTTDALRVGLVTQVVPAAELESTTYALAKKMCGLAPLAARWHKQILQTVLTNPGLQNLTPEQQALPYVCYDTQDFAEGRQAFIEKRTPNFQGK